MGSVFQDRYDVLIIGGGINGVGIARDAASQGFSVLLAEKGDLAGQTSSASTKLIHGGLRYLENYDFRLVRESLRERDVLMRIAPHLIKPMQFILPHMPDLRPRWMIGAGLFLYDFLAGKTVLPRSYAVMLDDLEEAKVLKKTYIDGFVYSDCWVDDARLVVLNAVSAAQLGADIRTRHRVDKVYAEKDYWVAQITDVLTGAVHVVQARSIVNAAGPAVRQFLDKNNLATLKRTAPRIRLVQGSHIIIPKLYDGQKAYILQQPDKRIVFTIPYEGEYTLVGTTETTVDVDAKPVITDDEKKYLLAAVGRYFEKPVVEKDIQWTYSGVRPLFDDGDADNRTITRDYMLHEDDAGSGAFILSIFGGKLTSYRQLSCSVVCVLCKQFGRFYQSNIDEQVLAGGMIDDVASYACFLKEKYPSLSPDMMLRYARSYGCLSEQIIGVNGMGELYGDDFYEAELRYLIAHEWARTIEDVLWRRTKLGLHLTMAAQNRIRQVIPLLVKEITGYDTEFYIGD